jgi:hypothetical protein
LILGYYWRDTIIKQSWFGRLLSQVGYRIDRFLWKSDLNDWSAFNALRKFSGLLDARLRTLEDGAERLKDIETALGDTLIRLDEAEYIKELFEQSGALDTFLKE